MTKEQREEMQWWTYLTRGISHNHAMAWYNETMRTENFEKAEVFKKRVNYINKRRVI